MNREETKRWLAKEIDYLEDKRLFTELTEEDMGLLLQYSEELEDIASEILVEQEAEKQEKSREMRNRRRRGKYGEKKVAKEIGGTRKGGVGMEDVNSTLFTYEVKTVKSLPVSITKGLAQAIRLGKAGKIPVLVFRCGRDTIYCVNGEDWRDLHGGEK